MQISIAEIMELIPHRYPFLLIDRVFEFEAGKSIHAIKNVTFNEPQFTGHFPNKPVMPGVLIIEAMAQASAILVSKSMNDREDKDVYFMSIEKAKFRRVVEPGDTMNIYAKIDQNRGQVWKFSSFVEVNNVIVAESEFTAMVKNRD